ncbi:hypothetical protein DIPPA_13036 [Diplonema papillatum]|nr:hypothetical protein DIPPA_13036 [Diplonema papillatum]
MSEHSRSVVSVPMSALARSKVASEAGDKVNALVRLDSRGSLQEAALPSEDFRGTNYLAANAGAADRNSKDGSSRSMHLSVRSHVSDAVEAASKASGGRFSQKESSRPLISASPLTSSAVAAHDVQENRPLDTVLGTPSAEQVPITGDAVGGALDTTDFQQRRFDGFLGSDLGIAARSALGVDRASGSRAMSKNNSVLSKCASEVSGVSKSVSQRGAKVETDSEVGSSVAPIQMASTVASYEREIVTQRQQALEMQRAERDRPQTPIPGDRLLNLDVSYGLPSKQASHLPQTPISGSPPRSPAINSLWQMAASLPAVPQPSQRERHLEEELQRVQKRCASLDRQLQSRGTESVQPLQKALYTAEEKLAQQQKRIAQLQNQQQHFLASQKQREQMILILEQHHSEQRGALEAELDELRSRQQVSNDRFTAGSDALRKKRQQERQHYEAALSQVTQRQLQRQAGASAGLSSCSPRRSELCASLTDDGLQLHKSNVSAKSAGPPLSPDELAKLTKSLKLRLAQAQDAIVASAGDAFEEAVIDGVEQVFDRLSPPRDLIRDNAAEHMTRAELIAIETLRKGFSSPQKSVSPKKHSSMSHCSPLSAVDNQRSVSRTHFQDPIPLYAMSPWARKHLSTANPSRLPQYVLPCTGLALDNIQSFPSYGKISSNRF